MNPVSFPMSALPSCVRRCVAFLVAAFIFSWLTPPSIGQDDRELWVPTEHLETVLKKMPRAVFLEVQQYERLRAEFKQAHLDRAKGKIKPPVSATIRSASITGEVEQGASVVALTATYEVECFTEGWTEVPLLLPAGHLGHVSIDEQSAIRSGPKKPTVLLTHGRGIHTVSAIYHLPVKRSTDGNTITLVAPGIPAKVTLDFPTTADVESSLPFIRDPDSERVVFALPSQSGSKHEIRWSAQQVAPIPGAAVLQTCSYVYNLESTNIRADLGFVVSSNLTDLPRRFTIQYPENFRVLSVEGSELLRWDQIKPGELETVLIPGDRDAADLRILLERDLVAADDADAGDISAELPIVTIPGVHRASGTFSLIGSGDVRVKTIETGSLAAPIPDNAEGALANVPHYVASFSFPVSSEPPRVTLSPVQNRFHAQIDTLITLRRENIAIERSLQILPREGSIFHVDLTLPADEEFAGAISKREDFSWKRLDDGTLRLLWEKGTAVGQMADVTLSTRRDPEGWYSLGQEPAALHFAATDIAGADAVSGYLAVAFDPSFHVKTISSEGLEIRDARTTPVSGNLAWFRLEEFSLSLEASRRPPELEAKITAYVLPLATTLEIEGQLDLAIRYSGIDELDVTLPSDVAPLFRFDSPLIAEQTVLPDDAGWNLRFHQEQKKSARLKFRAILPVAGEEEKAETFTATLPRPGVPAAKRLRGHWIVEANTDTELNFESSGLDKIDSLRVPLVEGYQPRHRIIAAYRYRGDEGSLTLSGTRHENAEAVTTVVDSLRIDTVASTDGSDRHQARLSVRSAGEQFLELALPADAILWSLLIDGKTVKPVRAGEQSLRVQLPADKEGSASVAIEIIYQTPGKQWRGSGRETLAPLRLADRIPVMETQWFLHLPEGYDYQKFESNLGQEFEVVDRLLLGAAGEVATEAASSLFLPFHLYADSERKTGTLYESAVDERESISGVPRAQNAAVASDRTGGPTGYGSGGGTPSIATNYVIRLQEPVKKADEAALRGSQLMADGDYQGAIDQYRAALDLLPNAPMTEPRRRAYVKQYARGTVLLGTQRAEEGRYPEAIALVEDVLRPSIDPDNIDARRLLERLNDPDYYSPPLTPQHLERVRRVKLAVKTAQGYIDLGDHDRADREFHKALNDDPYNVAARRGQEKNERHRLDYYNQALDQTRSRMLRETAEGWEIPVPAGVEGGPEVTIPTDTSTTSIRRIEENLKTIILPSVEFADTPLKDALDFLQQRSVELDINEADPAKKGINIVLDVGLTGDGGFGNEGGADTKPEGGGVGDTPITLRLTNVPIGEALRYTTSLAQLKYKVEPHAIVVVPLSTPDADLFTNVYIVPPTFLSVSEPSENSGAAAADPFADPVEAGGGGLAGSRPTAKSILEDAGITFGPGATAIYNPSTGQLIVKNTQDQMDLVEAFQDSILAAPSPDSDRNGVPTAPRVFGSGGMQGNAVSSQVDNFQFINPSPAGAAQLRGFDSNDAGKRPLAFTLPETGRSYRFAGLYSPEPISFRFVNWERQIRLAWIWILAGGLAFWFGARGKLRKPVFLGLAGVIVLTFVPLIISKGLTEFCNALLLGWVIAMALALFVKISRKVAGNEA